MVSLCSFWIQWTKGTVCHGNLGNILMKIGFWIHYVWCNLKYCDISGLMAFGKNKMKASCLAHSEIESPENVTVPCSHIIWTSAERILNEKVRSDNSSYFLHIHLPSPSKNKNKEKRKKKENRKKERKGKEKGQEKKEKRKKKRKGKRTEKKKEKKNKQMYH